MTEPKTTSIHLSGPNNSTLFTDCCGFAVGDYGDCPKCGAEVLPVGRSARWEAAYGPWRATERRQAKGWMENELPNESTKGYGHD